MAIGDANDLPCDFSSVVVRWPVGKMWPLQVLCAKRNVPVGTSREGLEGGFDGGWRRLGGNMAGSAMPWGRLGETGVGWGWAWW